MACLSDDQLDRLASDRGAGDSTARLMDHIRACPACAERLDRYRADHVLAADLKGALAAEPSLTAPDPDRTDVLSTPPTSLASRTRGGRSGSALAPDDIPGYRIIREIHRGGQGVVYEAVQASTRRTVAVKVMLEGPFASERSRWRFEQEAHLIARLRHPNIVVVHDSGVAHGLCYYVMDYVRGQPLDTHVRLSGLSVSGIVRLVLQVCQAVAYAHCRGVIHRDLKPSNILVGENGHPQVLDFGLAKLTRQEGEVSLRPIATLSGQIMGTLRYMSPEQTLGDPDLIDMRTDVYTLGVILYELLTGRPPYATDGDLADALRNIREGDPVRPSRLRRELGTELDAVVLRAMAKEADRRYASAGELAADLAAWLDGRPVSAKSDSSFYVLRKLAVRHYFHTAVIAALLAAIVGFGGISFHALAHARAAVRQMEDTNRDFVALSGDLERNLEAARSGIDQQVLGWLLLEWQAGRTDSARGLSMNLREGSPERIAADFLLGDSGDPATLRQALPAHAASIGLFVIGERCLRDGRTQQAREAFEEYVRRFQDSWTPLVQARLDQIAAAGGAASAPAGTAAGD